MAPSLLMLFFFFFFPSLTFSLSTHPPPPPDLIQKTCNLTTYYDLCISSLCSNPSSSTADVKGLSAIIISAAITTSTNTSSYAAALSAKSSNPNLKSLLKTCAAKYSLATDALRRSLDSLADEDYDYTFVYVSAAGEYPNVCRVLFRQQLEVQYPAELGRREAMLEHLCTMASEIVSQLG